MDCDSPSTSEDRPGSVALICFSEILTKLDYMADFLVQRGQPANSNVIRQLRNAGIFGETVCRMCITASKLSFDTLLRKLDKSVLLTQAERESIELVFMQVTSWAHATT